MDSVRASISPALAGRYSIERELGSGAMALVFLAHDLKHDRDVAVKVLKPDIASAIGPERFHREIEVVARLTHPHILSLHDSGEAAGHLYFVMPYVEGQSVREALQRDGRLPVAEATRIAREMADALEFAHRHGVIHRDVKPANIMLTSGHALLADFGIARLVEGADTTLTGTGITVGTPAYMSPEQVSGDEPLDGRSDIYSLGCVLFEMLAGKPPFEDVSRRAVLVHHMVDSPPDIRLQCPEIPLELVGILRTTLEKNPDKRFASAAELSKALASVRSEIDATGGARLRRSLKRRGRLLNRGQRAGIAVLLVLAAIGGPAIVREVFKPAEPAIAGKDPRATYVVVPFARRGQTAADDSAAVVAADILAANLDGWERVDATLEHELTGAMLELGIAGPTIRTLEEGLLLARKLDAGTLIGIRTRMAGDTVFLESHQYDVASGGRLGDLQTTRSARGAASDLVAPIVAQILKLRGENPEALRSESRNQEAWQEFWAARSALYDWRLEEAQRGFEAAITLDPEFARAHHYLAVALFWQTSRDKERRIFLIPGIQRITGDAARLAGTAELNPKLENQIFGFHSLATGDYEGARRTFHELIAGDSTDTEAWLFLGLVESTDPWLAEGSDPPEPRADINLARRAFRESTRLWPESQISRGLEFEIVEGLSNDLVRAQCPVFWYPEADLVLAPYEDSETADWFPLFPLLEADTVRWVPCVPLFEQIPRSEARTRFGPAATRLYDEAMADIERWVRYAPEQPRPHEEWARSVLWWRSRLPCDADTLVAADLTREALGHLDAALALSADTTPQQRIAHAVLRMTAGLSDAPGTARLVAAALLEMPTTGLGEHAPPSWAAANAFMAAGQPSEAIEHMRGVWAQESRSAEDPDPESDARYDYGDVFQSIGPMRVLGAVGATGPSLSAAVAAVIRTWSGPEYSERARAVMRRSSSVGERSPTADITPALAVDPEARRLWFSNWGDLGADLPALWKGLLAVPEQADNAAAWLEEAVRRLEAMSSPYAVDYFVTGVLAQQVGDDPLAADLFEEVRTCPLDVRSLDIGWGLSRLSRLYRARSLERLGRTEEAAVEYAFVAGEWADAGPEVREMAEEARRGAERLADRP